MIDLRGFVLVCLFALPTTGLSQPIEVRSGEHDGFTRLVLNVSRSIEWQLSGPNAGNLYRLSLRNSARAINVSNVFSRIDRKRIASLSATNGNLEIELACNCNINVFRFQDSMLVLDVRDASAEEKPVAPTTGSRLLTQLDLGEIPSLGPLRERRTSLGEFLNDPIAAVRQEELSKYNESESELAWARRSIAESVADAAMRGLLDAVPRVDSLANLSPSYNETPAPAQPQANSLQLEEANEQVELLQLADGRLRIGAATCITNADLDFSAWAGDEPFSVQLAEIQLALTGEFDRLDITTLSELSHLYLFFGFGAEAIAVNHMLGDMAEPIVTDLARLVDGLDPVHGVFEGQAGCDTPAALWAVLSEDIRSVRNVNEDALLQGFEELPLHLRRYIGPVLAEKLTEFGAQYGAASVLNRLERAIGGITPDMQFAQAGIELSEGKTESAKETFSDLARADSAAAPQALVQVSNLASDASEQLQQDLVEIADAYATELRGTQTGDELWRVRLKGWADNHRFAEAFASLRSETDVSDAVRAATARAVVEALVADAPDIVFLKHILNEDAKGTLKLDDNMSLSVAERLLELGMPKESLEQLANAPEGRSKNTRLLAARALLDLGRPEDAEIELIGLNGDEVLRIRADARRQMGDFEYVQRAFSSIGDRETALDAAWIAGDLEALAAENRGVFSEVSRLALSDRKSVPNGPPTLSAATELAEDSLLMRSTIQQLLNETKVLSTERTEMR